MNRNKFKSALRVNTPKIIDSNFNNTDKTNLLLMKLGILPIPENIQANISEDGTCLNFQLKDFDENQHLCFQLPLVEDDLSKLQNRSDYQELIQRYYLYVNDYSDEVKKYAIAERKYLQEKFPGLVFNIKIRIKSYDSYITKLNENIVKGKDLYINDIMAERIVVSEYNGSKDEKILKLVCEDVAKALYDFRIDTNFRMKKEIDENDANSSKEYVTKDYISSPKKNGYESLHILLENKNNKDFMYETQVRTFEMEKMSKTSAEIAHTKYKPRLLNDLSPNRVPLYSEITPFLDKDGNPTIVDISLDNRFYHFYNSDRDLYSKDRKHYVPITYSKFREEQYKIEELLGIQFKDIRAKIREINLRDKSNKEKLR